MSLAPEQIARVVKQPGRAYRTYAQKTRVTEKLDLFKRDVPDEFIATPERATWANVIKRSIQDLDVHVDRRQDGMTVNGCCATRELALEWFTSDDTAPRTFLWACDMLSLDARRLRKLILSPEGRKKMLGWRTKGQQ